MTSVLMPEKSILKPSKRPLSVSRFESVIEDIENGKKYQPDPNRTLFVGFDDEPTTVPDSTVTPPVPRKRTTLEREALAETTNKENKKKKKKKEVKIDSIRFQIPRPQIDYAGGQESNATPPPPSYESPRNASSRAASVMRTSDAAVADALAVFGDGPYSLKPFRPEGTLNDRPMSAAAAERGRSVTPTSGGKRAPSPRAVSENGSVSEFAPAWGYLQEPISPKEKPESLEKIRASTQYISEMKRPKSVEFLPSLQHLPLTAVATGAMQNLANVGIPENAVIIKKRIDPALYSKSARKPASSLHGDEIVTTDSSEESRSPSADISGIRRRRDYPAKTELKAASSSPDVDYETMNDDQLDAEFSKLFRTSQRELKASKLLPNDALDRPVADSKPVNPSAYRRLWGRLKKQLSTDPDASIEVADNATENLRRKIEKTDETDSKAPPPKTSYVPNLRSIGAAFSWKKTPTPEIELEKEEMTEGSIRLEAEIEEAPKIEEKSGNSLFASANPFRRRNPPSTVARENGDDASLFKSLNFSSFRSGAKSTANDAGNKTNDDKGESLTSRINPFKSGPKSTTDDGESKTNSIPSKINPLNLTKIENPFKSNAKATLSVESKTDADKGGSIRSKINPLNLKNMENPFRSKTPNSRLIETDKVGETMPKESYLSQKLKMMEEQEKTNDGTYKSEKNPNKFEIFNNLMTDRVESRTPSFLGEADATAAAAASDAASSSAYDEAEMARTASPTRRRPRPSSKSKRGTFMGIFRTCFDASVVFD